MARSDRDLSDGVRLGSDGRCAQHIFTASLKGFERCQSEAESAAFARRGKFIYQVDNRKCTIDANKPNHKLDLELDLELASARAPIKIRGGSLGREEPVDSSNLVTGAITTRSQDAHRKQKLERNEDASHTENRFIARMFTLLAESQKMIDHLQVGHVEANGGVRGRNQ